VRAAVYNRFWHSMGGGERHAGMIAAVLRDDGVQVDLLGHAPLGTGALADHLGLDLSGVRMRTVPDRGEEALVRLSTEYDLFVNATYMSRLAPASRHAAYLCFFPTPFDHDLSPWRRRAIRVLGPRLRGVRGQLDFGWGTGWYPPEGGRLRQWEWTNGDGVLTLEPGPSRALRLDLGRPGAHDPVKLRVEAATTGGVLAEPVVGPAFQRRVIGVPASPDGHQIRFRSDTFVPGPADQRELGVAVSRLRITGRRGGVPALLAMRFPWLLRDPNDLGFLTAYDTVLANSEYTRGWIGRLWHTDADVLHPPIQVEGLRPAAAREKAVLSVGRFFAPGLGHAKRQLEMVRFFGDLVRSGRLDGWTMHVVGGCEDSQRPYLAKVAAAASGLPVRVHPNAPRATVAALMSTASVFWSATGYGEDADRAPWASEHFGMTTAEAMAGGCVPVVIDRAGQREIVRDGVDGFRWSTPDELLARTVQLAGDEALRGRLSARAVERARQYSDQAFAAHWRDIVSRRRLLEV
jgi:glycosyltransferase involved in cell wall biosynthesis